jgi:hypothetical protein
VVKTVVKDWEKSWVKSWVKSSKTEFSDALARENGKRIGWVKTLDKLGERLGEKLKNRIE